MDGNDIAQSIEALSRIPSKSGKPVAVIGHTVKGKGVSFMEDDNNWHYRIPTAEEVDAAYKELGVVA
jgi:transketolase